MTHSKQHTKQQRASISRVMRGGVRKRAKKSSTSSRSVGRIETAMEQMRISRILNSDDNESMMSEDSTIDIVQYRELDEDTANIVVHFPVDPSRLEQENDRIESSSSESSDEDDDTDSDDDMAVYQHLHCITPSCPPSQSDNAIAMHLPKPTRSAANPSRRYCSHSPDLMHQALLLDADGAPIPWISRVLGVPESTIKDYIKRYQTRGDAIPKCQKKTPTMKITPAGSRFLVDMVTQTNTLTLKQLQQNYYKQFGELLVASTIYRHLVHKCRITIKCACPYPERRTDEETRNRRKQFIEEYINSGIVDYQKNCVFVDEAAVAGNMRRNHAWAPAGRVAHIKIPQMHARTRSILAAISYSGIVEVCTKVNTGQGGGTKSKDFFAFLHLVLHRHDERGLKDKGWNIVCDNAPIHTALYIRNMVSERGYRFILLPHYSPFLNPIEEFFSKVKLLFRHVDNSDRYHESSAQSQNDDIDERLKRAVASCTISDYASWVNHSIKFFDRCLALEHNL